MPYDDQQLDRSNWDIAGDWIDRDAYAIAVLHGVANHHQNMLMSTDTWLNMANAIQGFSARGLSGQAGGTTIRTFSMAGRVMISYARPDGDDEHQVTFLAYERDDTSEWWGGAIQSINAPLSVVLDMINDVAHYTFDLTPDKNLAIG